MTPATIHESVRVEDRICSYCVASDKQVLSFVCSSCGRQCCPHNCTDKGDYNSCVCQTCYLKQRLREGECGANHAKSTNLKSVGIVGRPLENLSNERPRKNAFIH